MVITIEYRNVEIFFSFLFPDASFALMLLNIGLLIDLNILIDLILFTLFTKVWRNSFQNIKNKHMLILDHFE